MNAIFLPIFVLLLSTTATAGERPWKTGPSPAPERAARRDRVRYDAREGGGQLARGATWKASFDARGATYVPFLGS